MTQTNLALISKGAMLQIDKFKDKCNIDKMFSTNLEMSY